MEKLLRKQSIAASIIKIDCNVKSSTITLKWPKHREIVSGNSVAVIGVTIVEPLPTSDLSQIYGRSLSKELFSPNVAIVSTDQSWETDSCTNNSTMILIYLRII